MSGTPSTTACGYYHTIETEFGFYAVFSPNWCLQCDDDHGHAGPFFVSRRDGRSLCQTCWLVDFNEHMREQEARGVRRE